MRNKSILLLGVTTLLFILSSRSLHAQFPDRFSFETYVNGTGDSLRYRLLFPDYNLSRRYPLMIFLHGSGERGDDNKAQLKWGVQSFASDENMMKYPALVIAPQCPLTDEWSSLDFDAKTGTMKLNPTPTKSMKLLVELIREMTKKFQVDTNRIYITGLSMGGFGTFDALMRYPDLFAAAVPVCGGGDISKAPTIASIPMWIFHGMEDPAVPELLSLEMMNAIVKAGGNPGATFYPEVGHFAWIAAYSDPYMIEWLFRQRKK